MAIYYVSPSGSDSNNGLGPDPTHATNKPYLTLAKAIGASGAAAAGDTVYVAPGVYRANLVVGVSGASGSPISVFGDPANAQGFKDASGNLLSAGEVRVTNYVTNDTTLPVSPLVLSITSRSYLAFANIWWIGGSATVGAVYLSACRDLTFTSCAFSQAVPSNGGQSVITLSQSTQLVANITIDRCVFAPLSNNGIGVILSKTSTGSADYNANVTIQNCLVLGGASSVNCTSTGTGTYLGGGVAVRNCSLLYSSSATVNVADAGISTTYPVTVNNCIAIRTNGNCLVANTSGQIVEDYNWFYGRTNVPAASPSHSIADASYAPLLDFGQWSLWGQQPRPLGTPTVGSPMLGFGNAPGAPSIDFLGRPRPEGGNSLSGGVGYVERHDTAVQETTVTDSGGVGLRIDGPGSQEFQIPVDATATTISVKCQYDANHGTATPPQAILVATPELGVASQTLTASPTSGSWQTLTFSAITPTDRGVVRVQLVARPSAANGKCYFDTFAVS